MPWESLRVGGGATLTEQSVVAIRAAIDTGMLIPGELYSVNQLAQQLGVSRSPVRDALLRLEETGLVQFERNRGFRLLVPDARTIAELFGVRIALEVPAARRAAAHSDRHRLDALHQALVAMREAAEAADEAAFMFHDKRLHEIVLSMAGNGFAMKVVDNVRDAMRMVGPSTVERARSLQTVLAEHEPIVAAIARGDGEAAARAMRTHLITTGDLLLERAPGGEREALRDLLE